MLLESCKINLCFHLPLPLSPVLNTYIILSVSFLVFQALPTFTHLHKQHYRLGYTPERKHAHFVFLGLCYYTISIHLYII